MPVGSDGGPERGLHRRTQRQARPPRHAWTKRGSWKPPLYNRQPRRRLWGRERRVQAESHLIPHRCHGSSARHVRMVGTPPVPPRPPPLRALRRRHDVPACSRRGRRRQASQGPHAACRRAQATPLAVPGTTPHLVVRPMDPPSTHRQSVGRDPAGASDQAQRPPRPPYRLEGGSRRRRFAGFGHRPIGRAAHRRGGRRGMLQLTDSRLIPSQARSGGAMRHR